jgi:Ala-tRNA(Pro) deacylase
MPLASLTEYLDKHHVKYMVISHSPAYTAQGIAAISHTPGKQLAKIVVVKLDGDLTMVVLPASFQVDVGLLKNATNAKSVQLASEEEFKGRFPECETGAIWEPLRNQCGRR